MAQMLPIRFQEHLQVILSPLRHEANTPLSLGFYEILDRFF